MVLYQDVKAEGRPVQETTGHLYRVRRRQWQPGCITSSTDDNRVKIALKCTPKPESTAEADKIPSRENAKQS